MSILGAIRQYDAAEQTKAVSSLNAQSRPSTVTELIDTQIEYHKKKIADLEEAKAAISPDVEKAINALAKINL